MIVKVKDEIFREYDIRGIYPSDINSDVSYTIGRSFGSYIKDKKVIIGFDNRTSSVEIRDNLVKGLINSSASVLDLGLVTTPMYYYAKKLKGYENGIMITASHNPKEYNGFKISFSSNGNACGKEIYDFRDYTNKGIFCEGEPGKCEKFDIKNSYLNLLKDSIDLGSRKVKVVVDCGNGTASTIIKDVMNEFNLDVYYLNCTSIPSFPNHEPDPAVYKNQIELSNKVKELGYDFGFGVDGDADRVGIVSHEGDILAADLYLALMYRALRDKTDKAIFDVKCSKALIDDLERQHYKTLMYRTGNSYMNAKINKDNYLFGGEFSGHVWFRDKFPGFDDGIYAGLRVVELLSKSDKGISEMLEGLNKYFVTEEIKIAVKESNKFEIVSHVKKYCDQKRYKYIDIDGVRVCFDDGWALIRPSNTGPNIIARFEAKTEDKLALIKNEFMDQVIELKDRL